MGKDGSLFMEKKSWQLQQIHRGCRDWCEKGLDQVLSIEVGKYFLKYWEVGLGGSLCSAVFIRTGVLIKCTWVPKLLEYFNIIHWKSKRMGSVK